MRDLRYRLLRRGYVQVRRENSVAREKAKATRLNNTLVQQVRKKWWLFGRRSASDAGTRCIGARMQLCSRTEAERRSEIYVYIYGHGQTALR